MEVNSEIPCTCAMTAACKGTRCVAKAAYVEHGMVYNNKNKVREDTQWAFLHRLAVIYCPLFFFFVEPTPVKIHLS